MFIADICGHRDNTIFVNLQAFEKVGEYLLDFCGSLSTPNPVHH